LAASAGFYGLIPYARINAAIVFQQTLRSRLFPPHGVERINLVCFDLADEPLATVAAYFSGVI
jgi:hypothetical protein